MGMSMLQLPKGGWRSWAALTTVALCVLAAFAALRAVGYSTRAQLDTTREVGAWAQFQNKSVKQSACEMERDLVQALMLEAQNPETRGHLDPVLSSCLEDIQRHDREKGELRKQAEDLQGQQKTLMRRSGAFFSALLLFQLAAILASLALLLEKPQPWVLSLAFAAAGILFILHGLLLLF